MSAPQISVITAVYNGGKYLDQCLESVRGQTFADFELIVVNDASTDNTPAILEKWKNQDSRVKVLHNTENKGRAISRNRAITASRAPLIAVLDADDYSVPTRLEIQFAYLREHPEVQVLGGDFIIHGINQILTHMRDNDEIRADMFFDSGLFHSTVMMRKSILNSTKSWYDPELPLSQDYGLWVSLMKEPTAIFANLPVPLTYYRVAEEPRPGYADRQFKFANVARARILSCIGIEPNRKNMACHLALLYGDAGALGVTPVECAAYGKILTDANSKKPLTNPEILEKQISQRLSRVFARDIIERKANKE